MTEIIIAVVVTLIVVMILGTIYWYATAVPVVVVVPKTAPALTYNTISSGTPETSSAPALPGTIVISNSAGQSVTQYGDETPVSASEDEHFQPYMSVLTNDVFRSDAAFDAPLSRHEQEIFGNYD